MAGEWIKMRADLKDDPSVFRLSKALKIDRMGVVGRLYALWAWADLHSTAGRIDGAEAADVDDMCERKGFAQALVSVGWLEIGDGYVAIPKHERHNGNSAKERSLKNARQARWRDGKSSTYQQPNRDAQVDADVDAQPSTGPSTREEKRREEPKTTPPQEERGVIANAPAISLPRHWTPSDDLLVWAATERPDLQGDQLLRVTMDFRDHWVSKGEKRADWDAAWRKWIRRESRAPPQASRASTKAEDQAKWAAELTGRGNGQRTIDGTAERVD